LAMAGSFLPPAADHNPNLGPARRTARILPPPPMQTSFIPD
jgi:hypothetical protein